MKNVLPQSGQKAWNTCQVACCIKRGCLLRSEINPTHLVKEMGFK